MKWIIFGFGSGALRFAASVTATFVSISMSPCVSSVILASFLICSGWSEVDVRPELRQKKKNHSDGVTGSNKNRIETKI